MQMNCQNSKNKRIAEFDERCLLIPSLGYFPPWCWIIYSAPHINSKSLQKPPRAAAECPDRSACVWGCGASSSYFFCFSPTSAATQGLKLGGFPFLPFLWSSSAVSSFDRDRNQKEKKENLFLIVILDVKKQIRFRYRFLTLCSDRAFSILFFFCACFFWFRIKCWHLVFLIQTAMLYNTQNITPPTSRRDRGSR